MRRPLLILLIPFILNLAGGRGRAEELELTVLGPEGGDVRSLAVHPQRPDVFYLGTADGRIYVSPDTGRSWRRIRPGLGGRQQAVDNLAFDPDDPETLYAATWELTGDRGELYRSRDGGDSWNAIPLGRYQSAIRALAIAPSDPRVIALGITEGVILSRDGGQNWDRITRGYRSLYHVESLAFDPADSETLYVGTWRLGWKTTSLGKRWEAIHKGMAFDSDLFSLLVDPANPGLLYSSACTGIYKSTNGGSSWLKLKNGLTREDRRTRALQLDPSDPNRIFAGTTRGLYRSEDAGASWQRMFDGLVVNAVAVRPASGRIVLAGTDDGGVLRSEDGGRTFQPSNRGFVSRQVSALAVAATGSYYAAVSADGRHGGFFSSLDGGQSWRSFNQGLEEMAGDIRSILPSARSAQVYLATSQGVFAGAPGGGGWEHLQATGDLSIRSLKFTDRSETGLMLSSDTGVFRYDLRGSRLLDLGLARPGRVDALFHDASGLVLAGTESGLFRSTDAGKTWRRAGAGLPESRIHSLNGNGPRFFAATRQGLFYSDDRGATWQACSGIASTDILALSAHPGRPAEIIAADALWPRLFLSRDGGNDWMTIELGSDHSAVVSLAITPSGDVLAGTLSEGVYSIPGPATANGMR